MSSTPILYLDPKLAGEVLVYSVDFSPELGAATITGRSVADITGGTAGAAGGSGGLVSALISGGTADGEIRALYQATTSDGQTLQCWIVIPVQAPPS